MQPLRHAACRIGRAGHTGCFPPALDARATAHPRLALPGLDSRRRGADGAQPAGGIRRRRRVQGLRRLAGPAQPARRLPAVAAQAPGRVALSRPLAGLAGMVVDSPDPAGRGLEPAGGYRRCAAGLELAGAGVLRAACADRRYHPWLGLRLLKQENLYPSLRIMAWLDIAGGAMLASVLLLVLAVLPPLAATVAMALARWRAARELERS